MRPGADLRKKERKSPDFAETEERRNLALGLKRSHQGGKTSEYKVFNRHHQRGVEIKPWGTE